MDAADFRRFAKECERWARKTTDPSGRQIMLDMARTWKQIAMSVEHQMGLLDDTDRMRVKRRLQKLMD